MTFAFGGAIVNCTNIAEVYTVGSTLYIKCKGGATLTEYIFDSSERRKRLSDISDFINSSKSQQHTPSSGREIDIEISILERYRDNLNAEIERLKRLLK